MAKRKKKPNILAAGAPVTAESIIPYFKWLLGAGEGGLGSVHLGYDDATREYVLTFHPIGKTGCGEVLASSQSIHRLFVLAISGEKFDA